MALGLGATAAAQSGGAVLYGDTFLLSGSVQAGERGDVVVVLARPHGRSGYGVVGRTRTTGGGAWRYNAKPRIRTTYRARVDGQLSRPVEVQVEPRLTLRGSGGRFTASVRAARSLAGKYVVLQRRTSGSWQFVRRLVLGDGAAVTFDFAPPGARTQIRVLMPRSQVGPGYVAARSGVVTLLRR